MGPPFMHIPAGLPRTLHLTIFLGYIRHRNVKPLRAHFDKTDDDTRGKQNVFFN